MNRVKENTFYKNASRMPKEKSSSKKYKTTYVAYMYSMYGKPKESHAADSLRTGTSALGAVAAPGAAAAAPVIGGLS